MSTTQLGTMRVLAVAGLLTLLAGVVLLAVSGVLFGVWLAGAGGILLIGTIVVWSTR